MRPDQRMLGLARDASKVTLRLLSDIPDSTEVTEFKTNKYQGLRQTVTTYAIRFSNGYEITVVQTVPFSNDAPVDVL